MAFDPTKFGATPVTTSAGGFDASKFGATTASQTPAPQQAPKTPSLSESIWSGIAGVGHNIANTVQKAGDDVNAAFTDPTKNPVSRGFDASVAAAGAVPQIAASAVPGAQTVLGGIGKATGGAIDFAGNISNHLSDLAQHIGLMSDAQRQREDQANAQFANSAAGKTATDIATVGQGAGTIANTILTAQGAASAGDAAVNTVKDVLSTSKGAGMVADAVKSTPEPVVSKATPANTAATNKIQELISPKVDAKATKLALAEGRVQPGEKPGLLRDGTPDTIMPSKESVRAAQTIQSQIPRAAEMTQPQLHDALDTKVTQIATKLQPEMEKVPITDQVVSKMNDAWEAVKTKQMDDPYSPPDLKLEKLQAQFQREFLDPIANKSAESVMNDSLGVPGSTPPTMDVLWDHAKAYDASVPANVRSATSLSSDVLQAQKSVWLQNRAILRDAIKDTATGLGEQAQKAFADMTDMYTAQKGIQSSFKLPKEGAPSSLREFANSKTGKVIKTVAKVGVGVEAGKRILTGEF